MPSKCKWFSIYGAILGPIGTEQIDFEELINHSGIPPTKEDTKKKRLNEYLSENPRDIFKIRHLLPTKEVVTKIVQEELGHQIKERDLFQANSIAKKTVDQFLKPLYEREIDEWIDRKSKNMTEITKDEWIDYLMGDYHVFQTSRGNSLISLAGGVNEELLKTAMENDGLKEGIDFKKTGGQQKGDFIMFSTAQDHPRLFIEVKSYKARERLQRGLADISDPDKVGFGFFTDAREFGINHAHRLIAANASAVYLPRRTLEHISADAREVKASDRAGRGSLLFRPIEQFVTDMKEYRTSGQLPLYI